MKSSLLAVLHDLRVNCGKIIDFYSGKYDNLRIPDSIRDDFTVFTKRVISNGFCEHCLKRKESKRDAIERSYIKGKKMSKTEENIKDAISGEHYETVEMYPQFAKEVEEEGNPHWEKMV